MCGIVGVVAERNAVPILMEGLRRLEYRGYDSAGLAVIDRAGRLARRRAAGKVAALAAALEQAPLAGGTGIAHTRWATHGAPVEQNAHPHHSRDSVAVVHNGIIENYQLLRERLRGLGYRFDSDTDTEVIAHLVHHYLEREGELLKAVQLTVAELHGAYSIAVIAVDQPERLVVARQGSPLVIGIGIGEHFIASDVYALAPVTQRFVFLEDGDVAELSRAHYRILDHVGQAVERPLSHSRQLLDVADKGGYRHYMLKEIFEQPAAVANTLEGRVHDGRLLDGCFGPTAEALFERTTGVHIIACGTSYHAGLVARYQLEALGIPCQAEIASEYRYRPVVTPPGTLAVCISQSGETADTLAALASARQRGCIGVLAICNVAESSLVRAADAVLLTRAGREIGVASTKAFTTQLTALQLLAIALGRRFGLDAATEAERVRVLQRLPGQLEQALGLSGAVEALAEHFIDKQHALFLGRGELYPVAMEGALKLKEISYIHAEAYAAGELKHGPLALVDEQMPVVAVLPSDALLEKLLSNLQEVRARGGQLFLFADHAVPGLAEPGLTDTPAEVLTLEPVNEAVAPIVFTVPLQLLAYHVAVLKGTDVDQPRNLAKSVTVE